jgi:hypothetical protein
MSIDPDGSYVIAFYREQCARTLITDYGVLTCERVLGHDGHCAVRDERHGLVIAVVAE